MGLWWYYWSPLWNKSEKQQSTPVKAKIRRRLEPETFVSQRKEEEGSFFGFSRSSLSLVQSQRKNPSFRSDQATNFYAPFDLMSLLHLFLFVGLVSLEAAAASFPPGSRSILRDIGGNIADQKDNAVELNATNFDSVFLETPAKYAILEFFAHWSVFLILSLSLEQVWILFFRVLVCLVTGSWPEFESNFTFSISLGFIRK